MADENSYNSTQTLDEIVFENRNKATKPLIFLIFSATVAVFVSSSSIFVMK